MIRLGSAIVVAATCALVVSAFAGDDARATAGKAIFHKGGAETPPAITAHLAESSGQLSGQAFACGNCHGAQGEGSSEAGQRMPGITWDVLASSRTASALGRARGPYDDAALKRAITRGTDADGRPLGAGMPRYRMSDGQLDDLVAYLRVVGTGADSDPGLGEDFVRVGAALPLTGPMAEVGLAVAATLKAFFDDVNARGGIYQRRIALAVEDIGGDAPGAEDAVRRLIAKEPFALVGSFQPLGGASLQAMVTAAKIPSIGPLAQAPRESSRRGGLVWYLLPTFADQARVLVDYVNSAPSRRAVGAALRVAVIHADAPTANDAAAGAMAQLGLCQVIVTADLPYGSGAFRADEAARMILDDNPEWVLFFGSSGDLETLAGRLTADGVRGPSIGALTLLSPPRERAVATKDVVFASPFGAERARPSITAGQDSPPHSGADSAFQAMALAAAKTLVEAMSRAGRNLTRIALASQIDQLNEFDTGILPPVTFVPNDRVGLSGAAIFGMNGTRDHYVQIVPWRRPAVR
jgi:ABC-type branched-subunit amino acid transport system substrate-binding protein